MERERVFRKEREIDIQRVFGYAVKAESNVIL